MATFDIIVPTVAEMIAWMDTKGWNATTVPAVFSTYFTRTDLGNVNTYRFYATEAKNSRPAPSTTEEIWLALDQYTEYTTSWAPSGYCYFHQFKSSANFCSDSSAWTTAIATKNMNYSVAAPYYAALYYSMFWRFQGGVYESREQYNIFSRDDQGRMILLVSNNQPQAVSQPAPSEILVQVVGQATQVNNNIPIQDLIDSNVQEFETIQTILADVANNLGKAATCLYSVIEPIASAAETGKEV